MIHLSLRLALTTIKRVVVAILPGEDNVLLTQNGDAIITQDNKFLKRQDPS